MNGRSLISVAFERDIPMECIIVLIEHKAKSIQGTDPPLLKTILQTHRRTGMQDYIDALWQMLCEGTLSPCDVPEVMDDQSNNALHIMMTRNLFGVTSSAEVGSSISKLTQLGVNPLQRNRAGQTPRDVAVYLAANNRELYLDAIDVLLQEEETWKRNGRLWTVALNGSHMDRLPPEIHGHIHGFYRLQR